MEPLHKNLDFRKILQCISLLNGAGVSCLGVVARVGIEASSDFVIDIGEQLVSSGFKLSEIEWGKAAFNAGIGIVIGEAAGHYAEPIMRNIKSGALKFHKNIATPFNDLVADGIEKVGKGLSEVANETANALRKTFDPYGGAQFTGSGFTSDDLYDNKLFGNFDLDSAKSKIMNFFENGDGSSNVVKSGSDKAVGGVGKIDGITKLKPKKYVVGQIDNSDGSIKYTLKRADGIEFDILYDVDGFPVFNKVYEMKLEPKDFTKSRPTHFRRAGKEIYEKMLKDPDLMKKFTTGEI